MAFMIGEAHRWVPVWGREYIEPAFAGDPDAAISLVVACHDYQRAVLVHVIYVAQVDPRAFREVLDSTWTQTHHYADLLDEAGSWSEFVRWFRYAAFEIPEDVPDPVTIYRRISGVSEQEAAEGLSWTLSRECAEWFSQRWDASAAVVVSATVPRSSLMFYSDERQEQEVIPDTRPPPGWRRL